MTRYIPILALLLLAGCVTTPEAAEPAPSLPPEATCLPLVPYAAWAGNTALRNPTAAARRLADEERAVFVAAFNATPPESRLHPADVYIWLKPNGRFGLVAMADARGCLTGVEQFPAAAIGMWIRGVVPGRPEKSSHAA